MFEFTKLIIFVRAPRVGQVKTRLAATMGELDATKAYLLLVNTLLERLRSLPNIELCFTPSDALDEISPWLQPGWEAHPQTSGDLGTRMEAAFARAFSTGCQQVVLIGSDCPYIDKTLIESAWQALLRADVVLGPATDGGYYLIGLRRACPEIFRAMPWSSSQVLEKTGEAANRAGRSVLLLPMLSDVDTETDWLAFLASQASGRRPS